MIEKTGSIWDYLNQPKHIVLVTTNNTGDKNNNLVMGAGTALEAKQRFPWLPHSMSDMIGKDYHLRSWPHNGIGCLQTKRHWKDPSPLDLIQESIKSLKMVADSNKDYIFILPRPGCGFGGLDWESQVKPLCLALPDNCIIISK